MPTMGEFFWRNDDGGIGTFIQVPGNNGWTSGSSITPKESQIYKYAQECITGTTDNSNSDAAHCGAISASQCKDGEHGQMVQWYVAGKGFDPPDWQKSGALTCVYDQKPVDVLEQIAAQIQTAFQQQPINAGALTSQPGINTLKGAQTNFVVDTKPQTFDLVLLGQKVHITATPVAYSYDYGDGTKLGPTQAAGITLSTDNIGQKTPTSHAYQDTLDYTAGVTTTFTGTYSVNGHPAVPIPGQGNFATNKVAIKVWRITTKLVDQNCLQNPAAWACPANTATK
ncbi:hypothetical protein RSal33209_2615 [Renibacterium salmoninarum ATCC 33209]|uniref:PKD domain-containing protein n=2 Tax=Renibacterium salmoninarum TaxID=1646 RepID=A9WRQ8_RENSM|nr:hypothetical protein [Renibacterium salmoninarum]ABY24340.1 hypothetical protein RSal33209_2615 [Renibacterium salmoninarum ATCC 33209]